MNKSGVGHLMTSRADGSMIRPFFTNTHRKRYESSYRMHFTERTDANRDIISLYMYVLSPKPVNVV
jgi:hypothetical protein